jgi:hypothetical protein
MKKRIFAIIYAAIIIVIMLLAITNVIEETLGMSIALALLVIFNIIVGVYAYKADVKIITGLMVLFAIVGLVLFGLNLKTYFKNTVKEDYKFQVTLENSESEKTLLFNYDNHNYYTYNTSNVQIILKEDGKTYGLQEALESNLITLDEILKLAIPDNDTLGYKIYYDGGQKQYENDEYSIVVCENSTNDVIFGTYDYTYEDGICN